MSVSASPRWRRRKQARPAEIIAAALEVFAERGFAAARLDDIAASAGVSKAALYLYFPTKEDLFRAVVAEAVAPNLAMVQAAVAEFDGRLEDLARFLVPMLAKVAANPPLGAVVKMVIGESRNFPELARVWHDDLVATAITTISGLIAKAQAKGEVRAGDPRIFALSLISPILMSVIWRETFVPIGAPAFDLGEVAAQHVETALGGMLAREMAA
ncbi:MAG TPA: TetR/AcrR family transcriptional regulator [Caulobacteraceae bacterium]|jgi:AcrR family transcriptional regulator|nr:TetR/AcrR family transcriptional regulator [Caulobacteraceae bacterium]